jgi:2,4-dienoyl-CoA reductase-like NADH-dependent reductase (Old Yellow Enzyme family)/thioredoxin reductase
MTTEHSEFSHLLAPITLGSVEVRNRMLSSAHSSGMYQNNVPTRENNAYHAARAKGGIGLIIIQGTIVHPTSYGGPGSPVAYRSETIPAWSALADAVHEHGAKIFVQLLHFGKSGNSLATMRPLWSASRTLALSGNEYTHAMTQDEIREVIESFTQCAVNMKAAGMDGVELHGAHGYLIQQFISPVTNHRTDEYGGSVENRVRFALELCASIRSAVGKDFAVGIRLSADELLPEGLTPKEMAPIAALLEERGDFDFLNVSFSVGGGMPFATQQADMTWEQAAFVDYAAAVKQATKGIPVFAVCRIIDPQIANDVIATGKADMVVMTRAHVADPEIARKLIDGRAHDVRPCIGSNDGCGGRAHRGQPIGCTVNPEAGREYELGTLEPAAEPKTVVIVGGGPAGMEAARVAATRGHQVVLYERGDRLGGQLTDVVKVPHRGEFSNIVAWLEFQMRRLGVTVRLESEATIETLVEEGADCVIVAAGSLPSLPTITGAGEAMAVEVATIEDVSGGLDVDGKRVVLLAAENHHRTPNAADMLCAGGAEVHYVTRGEMVASDIIITSRPPVLKRMRDNGVTFYREHWIRDVSGQRATLVDMHTGEETAIDGVDLIVGGEFNQPNDGLFESLRADGRFDEVVAVGDCVSARKVIEAMREGHMAARAL